MPESPNGDPTRGVPPSAIGEQGPGLLRSPDRVVALADGVFAIVLTILVLEIAVPPDLSEQSLAALLEELRPTLVAWVISFLITGMYWVAHRDLFAHVRSVSRDLVWLSFLLLLPICLIPFATSMIGKYPDEPRALHIYGVVLIVASLMRLAVYRYVVRRPQLLWTPHLLDRAGLGLALAGAPIAVYMLAMLVAEASPTASLCLFFSVPALYFLLVTVLRERAATKTEAEEFS